MTSRSPLNKDGKVVPTLLSFFRRPPLGCCVSRFPVVARDELGAWSSGLAAVVRGLRRIRRDPACHISRLHRNQI
ncbi:hypothetical protein ISCGN_026427 [Ixodes scapularis]